jgi:hypothetical protein
MCRQRALVPTYKVYNQRGCFLESICVPPIVTFAILYCKCLALLSVADTSSIGVDKDGKAAAAETRAALGFGARLGHQAGTTGTNRHHDTVGTLSIVGNARFGVAIVGGWAVLSGLALDWATYFLVRSKYLLVFIAHSRL